MLFLFFSAGLSPLLLAVCCGLARTTLTSPRHKWGGSRETAQSSSTSRDRAAADSATFWYRFVLRGPALIWYSSPRFSFSLFVFMKCVSYCCCYCCWRSWSNCNYCECGCGVHVVVVIVVTGAARVVLFSLSHALLLNVSACCAATALHASFLWGLKSARQISSAAKQRLRLQRQRLFLFTCSLQSYLAVHAVLELRALWCELTRAGQRWAAAGGVRSVILLLLWLLLWKLCKNLAFFLLIGVSCACVCVCVFLWGILVGKRCVTS